MTRHDPQLQQEQELLQHFRQHSQGEPSAALDALILDAARQAVAQAKPQPSWTQRVHAWLFGAGSRTRWSVAFASLATLGIGLSLTWRTQEQLPGAYDLPAPVAAQAPAAPVLREVAPSMAGEVRKPLAEAEKKKTEVAGFADSEANTSAAAPAPAPAMSMARQAPLARPQSAPLEAMADSVAAQAEADVAREQAREKAKVQAVAQASAKAREHAAEQAKAREQAGGEPSGALSDSLSEEPLAESLGHSAVDEAPPLELRLHNVLRLRKDGQQEDADRLLQALRVEYPQLDLDAELKRLQSEAEKPASSP